MRVFVLGAGASSHAGYPVTKDLGRRLTEWAAGHRPPGQLYWIDPDELAKFGSINDIEEIVTRLEEGQNSGPTLSGLRDALCAFFDSLRVNDAALYRQLAREIVHSGDVVVSFNYDVSLDRELRRAGKWHVCDGYGFNLGIASLPSSGVILLKLHGSTNWMDVLFDGLRGGSVQVGSGDSHGRRPVLLPQELEFLEYVGVRDPRFNGGGMTRSGSMILPGRNKQLYISTSIHPREREPFWSELWKQAAEALQMADEIVIIGYSLPTADGHARNLIFKNSNRSSLLTICCGGKTGDLGNEFTQAGFERDRVCTDNRRFEDWLAAQCCVT